MVEREARAIVEGIAGLARRLVLVSSGDVYRAFGRNRRTDGRPAVYNVVEAEAFTALEWVRRIADAAGWRGRIVVTRAPTGSRSGT
jgi:hypothetical protein